MCFVAFSRRRTVSLFDPVVHLALGDVAICEDGRLLRMVLK